MRFLEAAFGFSASLARCQPFFYFTCWKALCAFSDMVFQLHFLFERPSTDRMPGFKTTNLRNDFSAAKWLVNLFRSQFRQFALRIQFAFSSLGNRPYLAMPNLNLAFRA